jgi:hypothetical protein
LSLISLALHSSSHWLARHESRRGDYEEALCQAES